MKVITEVKTVYKYQADDGTIFDNREDAEHRDKVLKGLIRFCDNCGGLGETPDEEFRRYYKCSSCSGKGWQEKVEVWK